MQKLITNKLLICINLVIALFIVVPAFGVGVEVGRNCKISWTNPDVDADGTVHDGLISFKLFIGTASGAYGPPQPIILTPLTQVSTITCASVGITQTGQYYATVTALDQVGNESEKAVELPFTLDGTTPVVRVELKVQSQ